MKQIKSMCPLKPGSVWNYSRWEPITFILSVDLIRDLLDWNEVQRARDIAVYIAVQVFYELFQLGKKKIKKATKMV